jgi:hypothetical protein
MVQFSLVAPMLNGIPVRSCAMLPRISTVDWSLVRPTHVGIRMRSCAISPTTKRLQYEDHKRLGQSNPPWRSGAKGAEATKTCRCCTSLDNDVGYTACFPKHRKPHPSLLATMFTCRIRACGAKWRHSAGWRLNGWRSGVVEVLFGILPCLLHYSR